MKRPRVSAANHRTSTATSRRKTSTAHQARKQALHRQIRAQQPLHIRALLHPAGILVLLMVGVLFVGWTVQAAADPYGMVSGISADPLIDGAIITSPADGTTFTSATAAVEGTCPDNSYVKLVRNGTFAGTAWCVSNAFAIQTMLSAGNNILQAQDYNMANSAGPATQSIAIGYAPTAAPSKMAPVVLTGDYRFHDLAVGSSTTLSVQVSGGQAPYTLHVTWSDGSGATEIIRTAGTHDLIHRYQQAGYFPVLFELSDAAGQSASLQLAALIRGSGFSSLILDTSSRPQSSTGAIQTLITSLVGTKMLLWLAWPTYLILVLMAVGFWLGERQHVRRLAALPVSNRSQPRRSR